MNMKFTLTCAILFCVQVRAYTARNTRINKNYMRIAGGRNATEDEFTYAVKLMMQPLATRTQSAINVCSASVLTSKWTLTAAHCITGIEELMAQFMEQFKAVVAYRPSPKSEVAYSDILNMVMHPNFISQWMKNDIGLLQTQPVLFANYGKLSPIHYASLYGQEVSLVGFGMIKQINETAPHLPQILQVVVKECIEPYLYPQICFAPSCTMHEHTTFRSICPGDSGGPAIHESGIVSVNSMTDYVSCRKYGEAIRRRERMDTTHEGGIGAPVSPFLDWIASVMNSDTT